MSVLLFIFLTYSFAFIVTEQKVFEEVRSKLTFCAGDNPKFLYKKLCQLVHCPSCMGFWAGVILTIMGVNIFQINIFDPFFGGLFASLCCYFIHLGKKVLEKIIKDKYEIEL